MTGSGGPDLESLIARGLRDRQASRRSRARMALAVSALVVAGWLAYVTAAGQWERVAEGWAAAVTMAFGSFVAGSTPQGGGAVAFPVLTKVLEVPTSVARSFSLCIQAVGMTTAAAAIVINRRAIEWRAIGVAIPIAGAGFLAGLFLLGLPGEPFWPSRLPASYVKVTFTLIIVAMALVVVLTYREHLLERLSRLPQLGRRGYAALAVVALVGGVVSSLVGSGADVFAYIFLVVLLGVSPRVGVPSSVIVMAAVSLLGLLVLGIVDGQLDIALNASGDVVAVGGQAVVETADGGTAYAEPGTAGPPLPGGQFDLFGLWLAAVPVVAVGAPLGSWVASRITDRQLVAFVGTLAAAELVTTAIFLDDLRGDPALLAYAVAGLALVAAGLWALMRSRRRILGLAGVELDTSFTRGRLDVGPRYREQLEERGREDEEP